MRCASSPRAQAQQRQPELQPEPEPEAQAPTMAATTRRPPSAKITSPQLFNRLQTMGGLLLLDARTDQGGQSVRGAIHTPPAAEASPPAAAGTAAGAEGALAALEARVAEARRSEFARRELQECIVLTDGVVAEGDADAAWAMRLATLLSVEGTSIREPPSPTLAPALNCLPSPSPLADPTLAACPVADSPLDLIRSARAEHRHDHRLPLHLPLRLPLHG